MRKPTRLEMMYYDNETTVDRLRQVVRVLDQVKTDIADQQEMGIEHENEKVFDMAQWYDEDDCGTAGCAVGWAAQDPWFNARGLYIEGRTPELVGYEDAEMIRHGYVDFIGSWEKVKIFFRLNEEDINTLFSSHEGNRSIEEVIDNIKAYIQERE